MIDSSHHQRAPKNTYSKCVSGQLMDRDVLVHWSRLLFSPVPYTQVGLSFSPAPEAEASDSNLHELIALSFRDATSSKLGL